MEGGRKGGREGGREGVMGMYSNTMHKNSRIGSAYLYQGHGHSEIPKVDATVESTPSRLEITEVHTHSLLAEQPFHDVEMSFGGGYVEGVTTIPVSDTKRVATQRSTVLQ